MHRLTISVAEILGRPGTYRDLRVSEPLPEVRTALARVTDEPVDVDLRAESVVEGVLITGTAVAEVELQCARCLRRFSSTVTNRMTELFVAPGHAAPAEEDVYRVRGVEIDLEQMLRDTLTLALPLNPLCREDCRGICARCGADLNEGACGCTEDDTDPRWAALDELRERLKH